MLWGLISLTNVIEYATITAFMYPRCKRARLSGDTPPTRTQPRGATMGPWRKNHNKTSECQRKIEMWVKSNPKGEENGVTPSHIRSTPGLPVGPAVQRQHVQSRFRSSRIIQSFIMHHVSCVMCHASCIMTCWRFSMCFTHSNPKPHFHSNVTQPQPHSNGFLRRLYYSLFTTL